MQQVVFLLAFAQSVHAQPVPINSLVGCPENRHANFFTPMRKKECSHSEWPGQTDGRRVSLSTSMCNGWWNTNLPFYLPYLHSPCGSYNPPQFAALWPPITFPEITLCWWVMCVSQNMYVAFVPPHYWCQVTPSPYQEVAPLWSHSHGAKVLWHALPVGSDITTTVNFFRGLVIE